MNERDNPLEDLSTQFSKTFRALRLQVMQLEDQIFEKDLEIAKLKSSVLHFKVITRSLRTDNMQLQENFEEWKKASPLFSETQK